MGRRADEGVGFKRNKCWCCSVIFVKKKKQIIKREERAERERERERPREYPKRSRDPIFYGISMSIKKQKKMKKNGKQHAER